MEHDLKSLARRFRVRGAPLDIVPITAGHIHDTYLLTAGGKGPVTRYVLQRINQTVFKDPVGVMANIRRVTEHIHTKVSRTDLQAAARQLVVILTKEGESYYRDAEGDFWRVYNFIENAVTYDMLQAAEPAREAARMFGWFQEMLLDLPGPPLHETIPGFHNTPRRFAAFQEVLRADVANRAKNAQSEIDFVFEHAALCGVLAEQVAKGAIPVRIAHNDAKINNVMLDANTGKGVCVIDLDTVMPGLAVHDFGDLVRTAACPAAEDERDLAKVVVDLALFDALAQGFAAGTHRFLAPAERRHLVFGAQHITFEQLIRFLADYLAGDVYYKVHREGHNLDRSRTQMKLVQSLLEQEETLDKLVEKAFPSSAGHAL